MTIRQAWFRSLAIAAAGLVLAAPVAAAIETGPDSAAEARTGGDKPKVAVDAVFDGGGFEYAVKVPAVRKARQAFGRVLRGHEEVGARVLLDRRYHADAPRSVAPYLSDQERAEFTRVSPDMLDLGVERFWEGR